MINQDTLHQEIMKAEDLAIMKSIDDAISHFTKEKKVFSINLEECNEND